jgi:RNA polymerase sigma factor FliA
VPPNGASQRNEVTADGRERLLLENLTEVRYLARRIHQRVPSHVSFDDLFHAGILGLIDAVDKFDSRRNASLKSYARFRIRGAILDSLRQTDWGSRRLRREARGFERASRELTGELGHSPSVSQVASRLSLPIENLQRLLGELRGLRLGSLHAWSEDGVETEHSAVAFRPEEDPFEMTLRREIRHRLGVAQSELNEKERKVLGLYYLEELTMKKIGEILGIGESRVSQIHAAALGNLRSCLVLGKSRCMA